MSLELRPFRGWFPFSKRSIATVLIRLWHWICCAADSSHLPQEWPTTIKVRAYHPRSPWYLALIPSPSNQMEGMTSDRQTTCIQCKWKASATCRTGMTTHKKSGYESPAFTCYPGEDQNGMVRNLSRRIFNIHKSPQLSLKPTLTAAILSLLVSTKTP